MDKALWIATSYASLLQKKLEILTNNLSNVNTVGFKKDFPIFSLTYEPVPGVVFSGTYTDFSSGPLRRTGNPFDLAIGGDGFFVVGTKEGRRYTRAGDFLIDKDGVIVTKDGYPVLGEAGPIKVSQKPEISSDGTVTVNGRVVGKLLVVDFDKPYPLTKERSGLFFAQKGAKEKRVSNPNILQGYLEMSNTNVINSMVEMIEILRGFQTYQKVIQVDDSEVLNLINKVGAP